MSWLRVDDGFLENEKIADLSDRAFRLHMAGLCYCARNLTDGRLNSAGLRVVSALVRAKKQHLNELEHAQLWIQNSDGYVINDYLDYNPDAETVKTIREARKQAGQRGGLKSGQTRKQAKAEANASSNGLSKHSSNAVEAKGVEPRPVPYPLDQNPVTEPVLEQPARDQIKPNGSGSGEIDPDEINRLLTEAAVKDMPTW